MTPHTIIDCGWGRLLMGQTFASQRDLVEALIAETPQQRDVALYAHDPHVLVALAPQQLFLDPSHTFRLTYPQTDWQRPNGCYLGDLPTI